MRKILFMLTGAIMDSRYLDNIKILGNYIQKLSEEYAVDIACISGRDDFEVFDSILHFTYKVVTTKKQLDKVCDFVSECAESYDWYVKIRAEVRLLEQLDFASFCENSINARARVYNGPLCVKNGSAVGGDGYLNYVHAIHYSPELQEIVLDEMIYIFHKNIVERGFRRISDEERGCQEWYVGSLWNQHEWYHTAVWKSRGLPLRLVGLKVDFTHSGRHAFSADLNVSPCKYKASECPALRIT